MPVSVGVLPTLEVCRQARLSRDPRFDGRFFIGVLSTGIYCRTICPARMPKEENVTYHATAASAQDAGFRPCRRCRPEAATALPEWTLASDTVVRALRYVETGYLNENNVSQLAALLEVSDRHLSRLFVQELGTTPTSVAQTCRANTAKRLLNTTNLALRDVAYHAGYGSTSRFNYEIKKIFQATPSELRKGKRCPEDSHVEMVLPVSQPYDFDWVFEYLKLRALKRIESVSGGPGSWCYQRLIDDVGGEAHWLSVHQSVEGLRVRLPIGEQPLHKLLNRVKRVFDLNADGATLDGFLGQDPYLKPWVRQAPGLRVPGAWDGFETAVRAILGQQVSVVRGTELANKMIERYGAGRFPEPEQLVDREIAQLGMPGRRGRAISELARQVSLGKMQVDDCQDFDQLQAQMEALDGVGPWTANYVRMRACKDPNAFPDNDWVVMKQLDCSAAKARRLAEPWQPWRAYALMYLWYAASVRRKAKQKLTKGVV